MSKYLDFDQRQSHSVCECYNVLQGQGKRISEISDIATLLALYCADHQNATDAVANVDDYSGSARLLAATTLRNVLGTMTLGDILCQRESIAREMKVKLT